MEVFMISFKHLLIASIVLASATSSIFAMELDKSFVDISGFPKEKLAFGLENDCRKKNHILLTILQKEDFSCKLGSEVRAGSSTGCAYIDISGDIVDTRWYNQICGKNAAENIIIKLRVAEKLAGIRAPQQKIDFLKTQNERLVQCSDELLACFVKLMQAVIEPHEDGAGQ
jgi:hypothetical protein